LLYEPADLVQDPRHVGTLEPLWKIFDLTPKGVPKNGKSRSSITAVIESSRELSEDMTASQTSDDTSSYPIMHDWSDVALHLPDARSGRQPEDNTGHAGAPTEKTPDRGLMVRFEGYRRLREHQASSRSSCRPLSKPGFLEVLSEQGSPSFISICNKTGSKCLGYAPESSQCLSL
jgi:hypothetical protein